MYAACISWLVHMRLWWFQESLHCQKRYYYPGMHTAVYWHGGRFWKRRSNAARHDICTYPYTEWSFLTVGNQLISLL